MLALLTTRCGCVRQMKITYPPPREIHLPMAAKGPIGGWRPDPTEHLYDSLPRRIFRLIREPGHPIETASYVEVETYEPKETR